MSSSLEYVNFISDQLSGLPGLTYRKMFGEYALYYNGKVFGGIYDDRFLVKITKSGEKLLPDCPRELPYAGAKPMFLITELDDRDLLEQLVKATCAELPEPRKKTK